MFEYILFAIMFCGCVGIIAQRRGYSASHYFCLSLLITPILSLLILLSKPNLKEKKAQQEKDGAVMAQLRRQSSQIEELRRTTSDSFQSPDPRFNAPSIGVFPVTQNGVEVGAFTFPEIRQMLEAGQLSLEDNYFDIGCNDWIPLAGHPLVAHG